MQLLRVIHARRDYYLPLRWLTKTFYPLSLGSRSINGMAVSREMWLAGAEYGYNYAAQPLGIR